MVNLQKFKNPTTLSGKILLFFRGLLQCSWLFVQNPRNIKLLVKIMAVIPSYTMMSPRRLMFLYNASKSICDNEIWGDIVECGVWNGGSAAIMSLNIKFNRPIWLFDSFEGMPLPSKKDDLKIQDSYFKNWNKGTVRNVIRAFFKVRSINHIQNIRFKKGWFENTVIKTDIKEISLLHIDCDWYNSVKIILEHYYESVVNGGFIIIDDYYSLKGCKEAVDEFLDENKLTPELKAVDNQAVYFIKAERK